MPTPTEWLNEFQVNTGVAAGASESDPQIIGLANGNILVAWTESGDDIGTSNGLDIVGKIYDAEGNVVRDSYQLNTTFFADGESDFDIAATSDGGFVMVYMDRTANSSAVRWQRYDDTGNSTNGASVASTGVAGNFLANPQVSVNQFTNESVVTFTDDVGTNTDIRANTVSSTGIVGTEFDAAQNSTDFDRDADSALLTNGNLVSVYEEDDGGTAGIEAYITTTAGVQVANIQIVGGPASDPQVTALDNGDFAVTWVENSDIRAAVYNSTGGVVRAPFDVRALTDTENEPEIVAIQGGFVIAWDDDTDDRLEARSYFNNGTIDGGLFIPRSVGVTSPNLGVTADGRILVTWDDNNGTGEIFASIWDPRNSVINVTDYSNANLRNFVETNVVTSGTGNSTVNGTGTSDTILGQGGNDSLVGNSGTDSIVGGAGNDTIRGGFATDTLEGGIGNDLFVHLDGEFIDNVAGGSGIDTLDLSDVTDLTEAVSIDGSGNWTGLGGTRTISSIEHVIGTQGNDSIRNDSGNDTIDGQGGNDTLQGGFASDSILGGAGNDLIQVLAGEFMDSVDGGSGTDTLDHSAVTAINVSGAHFDFATGTLTSSFLNNPTATLAGIEVYLDGAGGNEITDRAGAFTIDAGAGDDTVNENAAGGTDNFDLGAGNDLLVINNTGIGGDIFDGGTGNDSLGFANVTLPNGTIISLRDSAITLGFATETILNFENVFGSQGNEVITGTNSGGNFLLGNGGNDTIFGLAGDDTLNGGADDDRVLGGIGNDLMFGGEGLDVMNGHGGNDTMNGGNGNDIIGGQFGNDSLIGGAGNDTIFGGGSNDTINAGTGNDFVNAGPGEDVVNGTSGADTLRGGGQDDTIDGGTENDLIIGDVGFDLLIGGSGNDTINAGGQADTLIGGTGADLLRGQEGFDVLDGGAGDGDILTGGTGADDFVFGPSYGQDTVTDFQNNFDELYLDDALWGGGLTAQQVVNGFASVVGGDTVLNFGGGDVLTVNGIGNAQLLVDDIVIV